MAFVVDRMILRRLRSRAIVMQKESAIAKHVLRRSLQTCMLRRLLHASEHVPSVHLSQFWLVGFVNLVGQLLYLAPIATLHMSPRRGVSANIHLALAKCTFALLVSIAMVPILYVACLVTLMPAHFASLATQHQLEKKPNSNIVAKLALVR